MYLQRNLTHSELISTVIALVEAERFKDYHFRDESRIESALGTYAPVAACGVEPWWTTVGEVSGIVKAVLEANRHQKTDPLSINLWMYASDKEIERFGFTSDNGKIGPTDDEVDLKITISTSHRSKRRTRKPYTLTIFNFGLDKDHYDDKNQYRREQRKYDKWQKEIADVITEILKRSAET